MTDNALLDKYNHLIKKHRFDNVVDVPRIISVIRESITGFTSSHHNVAIYCNGYHTKMLMADFIFELKDVKTIVDNYCDKGNAEGFEIITADEMESRGIDGVIISSYDYMDSIVEKMEKENPSVSYLNIYQKIQEAGINLQNAYYENAHPYQYYKTINNLQREIREGQDDIDEKYHQLIGEYIRIKDFRSAIEKTKEWGHRTELQKDLEELYWEQLEIARRINENHVFMLCIDGMQSRSFSEEKTPKLYRCSKEKGRLYSKAYSYSTSTYESLIPIYSENTDMRTRYYDHSVLEKGECRFVEVAKHQGRDIYFYTDITDFVEDPVIIRTNKFQTVTEKLWDFLVDAYRCRNGLFYVHVLYESHYSFVNPYTEDSILAEGTALLFDYLEAKGGRLRADYLRQHRDAMRYLDDVVTPILESLECPVVLYADHGNALLEKDTSLDDVSPQLLTCHEDLIRVPLAILNDGTSGGRDDGLISLMELNNIIISLLEKKKYISENKRFVKIGRSEIYNPDFLFLYRKMGEEYRLQAFEGFIFDTGEKLVVYVNGKKELYSTRDDSKIEDEKLVEKLFFEVRSEVTVC